MKRVHAIAQGGIKRCRNTGSYFTNAAFYCGTLRNGSGGWVTWTGDTSVRLIKASIQPPRRRQR